MYWRQLETICAQYIYLTPFASYEIWTFIGSANVGKSSDPYSVPVNILKIVRSHISEPPLALLARYSFTSGNLPDKLKLARVTLIFKKGWRFDKGNYRPSSALSYFRKYLKKLRIIDSTDFRIIYPQFGYKEKCSNMHAVISITESTHQSIDNNEFGSGIFIGLKKILSIQLIMQLTKHNYYEIRGNVHECFILHLSLRE